jgi:hypothetical protein
VILEVNLTGVWHGLYTYPRHLQRVLFDATLIESGRWLAGSTHEICGTVPHRGTMLFATLIGERTGGAVTFRKTYDGSLPKYAHSIDYEGVLSTDATEKVAGKSRKPGRANS